MGIDTESRPRALTSRWPFHVMVKPIGPICNLDCSYCFYLEKEAMYPGSHSFRMQKTLLDDFVRGYIESQPEGTREVHFAWQGGEPTLMGVDFFKLALEAQQRHARPGMEIHNALQTNGTRLDADWGNFLHEHQFLVGISVDGPEEVHDRYRFDKAGKGSYADVIRGIDVLRAAEVDFNTLTVVHHENAEDPVATYDFLKSLGSTFLQFIPIVEHDAVLESKTEQRPLGDSREEAGVKVALRSVQPEQWGRFLCGVFDRWLEVDDVGKIYVQHFDMQLGMVMGQPASVCVHSETCGRAVALEHNGDLYSCDHYVSPEYKLGNLAQVSLAEMLDSDAQREFGNAKRDTLPGACKRCKHLRFCWGACPKDRIRRTSDGEPGLAWLCEGYFEFYDHTLPVFQQMAECVRLGHPPRDYQQLTKIQEAVRIPRVDRSAGASSLRRGRNDPCGCGSGEKYKKCCGR